MPRKLLVFVIIATLALLSFINRKDSALSNDKSNDNNLSISDKITASPNITDGPFDNLGTNNISFNSSPSQIIAKCYSISAQQIFKHNESYIQEVAKTYSANWMMGTKQSQDEVLRNYQSDQLKVFREAGNTKYYLKKKKAKDKYLRIVRHQLEDHSIVYVEPVPYQPVMFLKLDKDNKVCAYYLAELLVYLDKNNGFEYASMEKGYLLDHPQSLGVKLDLGFYYLNIPTSEVAMGVETKDGIGSYVINSTTDQRFYRSENDELYDITDRLMREAVGYYNTTDHLKELYNYLEKSSLTLLSETMSQIHEITEETFGKEMKEPIWKDIFTGI